MKSRTKTPPEERWLRAVPDPEPRLRATPRTKKIGAALAMSGALLAGTQLGSSSDNAEKHLDDTAAVMTEFKQVQVQEGQGLTDVIKEALEDHALEEGDPVPELNARELALAARAISNTIRLDSEELPEQVNVMSNYPENETLPELVKDEKIYVPVEYRSTNE